MDVLKSKGENFVKLGIDETTKFLMDDKYTRADIKVLFCLGLNLKYNSMIVDISMDKLIKLLRIKERTLYQALKNLTEYGDIEPRKSKEHPNRYLIKSPIIYKGRADNESERNLKVVAK